MVICGNCEHENPEGASFCGQCGSELNPVNDEFVENVSEDLLSNENNPMDSSGFDNSDTFGQEDLEEDKSEETQLQLERVTLFHLQTKTEINVPVELSVIHIGKINERIPPDIDISGFPDSQIVSRVHADIVRENNYFYIEDTGSANGTYINHIPLPTGNRHKLRDGDRIALGKEDKVSFLFKIIAKD